MHRVDIDELIIDELAWHEGSLFTGTSVETWPDGALRSEQGRLVAEVPYKTGALHGLERHFFDDGRLSSETFGQYGIVLWRKNWDEAGSLTDEFEIDKNGYQYQRYLEELALEASGKNEPE